MSSLDCPSVEYEDVIAEEGRLNKDIRQKEILKTGIYFNGSQVLYGKLRPYLHNWLNPDFAGVAVGDWWVLRPSNMDKSFLYRLLQTDHFDAVANQSSGSKMPRADWKLVSNTEFIVPHSEKEQHKIAEFFNSIDDLITLHQRKLEHTKELKKSFLNKMFPKNDEKFPEIRFPGFSDAWEQRKLSEICKRITDGSHFSPAEVDKGYPMPSVKDMTENGFNLSSCKKISKDDYDVLVNQGCKPEIGDVLVAKDGSILKYAFVIKQNQEFVILSSIAILKPFSKYIDGGYLAQYFKIDDFKQKVINENTTGTGVPRIVLANFKNFEIYFPGLEEQQRIRDFLDSIDNLITLHQRKLDHLKQLKKGFLQQMFV